MIRVVTGNGGGYGDPRARDPEAITDDAGNGYVTLERAREVYGVSWTLNTRRAGRYRAQYPPSRARTEPASQGATRDRLSQR